MRFGASLPDYDVPAPLRGIVDVVRRRAEMRADVYRQGVLRDAAVVAVRAWDGTAADAMRGLSKALRAALQPALLLDGDRVVQALGSALKACDWDLKTVKAAPPSNPMATAAAPKVKAKAKKTAKDVVAPTIVASTAPPAEDLSALMQSLDGRCAALDLRPSHYFSQSLATLSAEQRAVLLDMHRAAVAALEREEEVARRVFEDSRVEALVDSRLTRLMLAANTSSPH